MIQVFLIYNVENITKKFNLYDFPIDKRKTHKKPIPLFGGVILLPSVFFLLYDQNFFQINDESLRYFFSCFILMLSIITVGIFDDLYDFDNKKRIIILFIIVFLITLSSPNFFEIKLLYISFYENDINTNYLKLILFPLGFIVLNTILNLIDGKNCILLGCFILIFFTFNGLNFSIGFAYMFLTSLILLFLNYKNKLFMGSLGVNLITLILSFQILDLNLTKDLYLDKIFIIFILPFFDAIYLLFFRAIKSRNPLKADLNHFHHQLIDKFKFINNKNCFLFYNLILIAPFLIYWLSDDFLITIIFFIIIYSIIRRFRNV